MAHIRCDFRSEALDMNTSMIVILPETKPLNTVKVVYLLHGLADNCSGWSRYTNVERYARMHDLALVIPEVQRSFYGDMAYGLKYFTFINEELHEICQRFFGFSDKRENRYVMGLSMGGYGALKCALTTPNAYAGCAAFSSVADLKSNLGEVSESRKAEFKAIFGTGNYPEESDNFALLEEADPSTLPSFYLACGEQDPLIVHSEKMTAALQKKGAECLYEHWTGEHTWVVWDEAVRRAIEYFFREA
ncbi:MAG: prolyl oligopeptidase family serine peptidase [Spirochaetales bacterium]|nr:prolyl oligopeptidase family serine peptidase [Candidatus Physcosoma equi]